ncbi:phage portal protein [Fructobacillus evanidus]|uniref:Phage portal protein, SPP1 family n=1 Tax=Fructobacillus evanidus TaxID=3064281 RepID=A0ABN9YIU7_9LACO|nr:hypothetical protein R55250_KEHBDPNM_00178 [Fructobacillus sp. LMG 32999]CAK1222217.1 hypothetical protein R53718_MFFEMHAI_00180 [Fructobacillus sp. LMG 32999]CAK1225781.1 hypothetical protein R54837_OMAIDLJD_00115 [Fructobacillus sp. LMG 32999]CAK1225997.1 hypothetical protein R53534_HOPDCFKK_00117 [Fructobacillus sp. LMG 32999]CAK1226142.1 hypothetical protein R55214_HHFBAMCI_00126 [Fructobacillus sp. LMG 32999]
MPQDYNTEAYNSLRNALMVYKEDENALTPERIGQFIAHHYNKQRPRLLMLDSYYKGINTKINNKNSRRVDEYGADVRLGHPFAQEIADFHTAFSVGNPITITVDSDGNGIDDEHNLLDNINDYNDIDALYYDLFNDMSKYGRAFANIYRDPDDKMERITRLSPVDTFIIYSNEVDPVPLVAVRYTPVNDLQSVDSSDYGQFIIETWSEHQYTVSQPTDIVGGSVANGYDNSQTQELISMPVVEFWNNSQRLGDYDGVISLIDAYDASQSDTANYMQDSNDAMLVIQGDIQDLLEGAELAVDPDDKEYLQKLVDEKRQLLQDIRKSRTLFLKSGISATGQQTSVSASYIHKEYDSVGVEAYKTRLYKNIHSFSRTPDVSDDNFANNSSGVAMQYKQLGVIQLAKTKRRMFEKGLTSIYRIIQELELAVKGKWDIDYNNINFMFTDNLPTDDVNTIQTLQQAGATFPRAYLDRFAPGISTDEMNSLREEQDSNNQAMQKEVMHIQERDALINSIGDETDDEQSGQG